MVVKDGVARERRISVGVRQGARVQIISGLQEGDQVVMSGGLGLEDKAKVAVQAPKVEEEEPADEDEPKAAPKDAKDAKGKDAKAGGKP